MLLQVTAGYCRSESVLIYALRLHCRYSWKTWLLGYFWGNFTLNFTLFSRLTSDSASTKLILHKSMTPLSPRLTSGTGGDYPVNMLEYPQYPCKCICLGWCQSNTVTWYYLCYNRLNHSRQFTFPGDAAAGLMSYWVITPKTAPNLRLE